jgi:pyruvate-formate lyase
MTNIPFIAIGAALTPVQRATNDSLRARKVQLAKDSHHTEDVEELDDTAVNSVNDQQEHGDGGGRQRDTLREREEEKVEIQALGDLPKAAEQAGRPPARPQLDISA